MPGDDFASEVAKHYNEVEQLPISERSKSDIIDLRKFNNAMKSMMHFIAFKFASTNASDSSEKFRILDLGCGKGGDLPKFLRNNRVQLIAGFDIADVSIEQCKERFSDLVKAHRSGSIRGEFVVADLTREDISEKLNELGINEKFNIASSQFSLHYSFESYEQAVRYLSNASKNLKKGGVFIGSYPDGPKLLKLARESGTKGKYEVEDIMSIEFPPESLTNPQPFGTKYNFKLKDVVDCPEFLVHPLVLDKLLQHLGLFQIFDRSFEEQLEKELLKGSNVRAIRELIIAHKALNFDDYDGKASLDENMWKAASIYRCFCYIKS